MTCLNLGIVGSIVDRSTPALVQGADEFLVVQMFYKNTTTPYSFQTYAGATGHFIAADSTITSIPATLESADLGKLRIELAASATSGLALGDEQSFQVDFDDDRGLSKIIFDSVLAVVAPLYPAT